MDHSIQISTIVFHWTGSHIPVFIEISFQIAIYTSQKHKTSDIEFPFLIEQWFFNVFLYNKWFQISISVVITVIVHEIFYFLYILTHLYSFASVRVLSWLYNPYTVFLMFLFQFVIIINVFLILFIRFIRNVECDWYEIKYVFVLLFKKIIHIMK